VIPKTHCAHFGVGGEMGVLRQTTRPENIDFLLDFPLRIACAAARLWLQCGSINEGRGESLPMFGMLDYRAHKLFWLLTLPFRLIGKAFYFIFIAIAVSIGIWTGYPPLAQMVIAYVAFEAMFLVFGILWLVLITLPVEKIFLDSGCNPGSRRKYRRSQGNRAERAICLALKKDDQSH
jgi:hypothetical protein